MSSELCTLYESNYKINNGDVLVAECLARRSHPEGSGILGQGKKSFSVSSGKRYKSVLVQKLRDFCGGDYR